MATLTVTVPEHSQNSQGVAVIKAPLEKVFEAHTNADLFKQWFARGNDATVHKFAQQMIPRVGSCEPASARTELPKCEAQDDGAPVDFVERVI